MKELNFKGITFDDFVVDADGGVWSQMCDKCVYEHEVEQTHLDTNGSGICGVKGCNNESDTYIDWTADEISINEVK